MQVPGLDYEQGDDEIFFEYQDRIRLAEESYKKQMELRKKIIKALKKQEKKEREERRRTNGSMVGQLQPVTYKPTAKPKFATSIMSEEIDDETDGGRKTRRKSRKSKKSRKSRRRR